MYSDFNISQDHIFSESKILLAAPPSANTREFYLLKIELCLSEYAAELPTKIENSMRPSSKLQTRFTVQRSGS